MVSDCWQFCILNDVEITWTVIIVLLEHFLTLWHQWYYSKSLILTKFNNTTSHYIFYSSTAWIIWSSSIPRKLITEIHSFGFKPSVMISYKHFSPPLVARMSADEDAEKVQMNCDWLFLWLSVSRGLDEPGSHPPPQREAAGSRSQLPPSAWSETRRQHHPVQLAQAVEHHGETGPADHEPLTPLNTSTVPTTPTLPPQGLELGWIKGGWCLFPPILWEKTAMRKSQATCGGSTDLCPPLAWGLPLKLRCTRQPLRGKVSGLWRTVNAKAPHRNHPFIFSPCFFFLNVGSTALKLEVTQVHCSTFVMN